MAKIIAYDLATDGVKASLHGEDGAPLASVSVEYNTYYLAPQRHEQRPMDWWDSVCKSTKALLEKAEVVPRDIAALALSGHSLVVAPLDSQGNLLLDQVPIWSDTRAEDCLAPFFEKVPYLKWYSRTGNGDPPACYSIFKLKWMKEHQPQIFAKVDKVLGSKDFINFMLTGEIATDPSYASGTGVFDLIHRRYHQDFILASDIPEHIFPPVISSHNIVGRVTKEAAAATGLAEGTLVACGGVDNSCMALGALGAPSDKGEQTYVSLGSSCWVAVNVKKPLIETRFLPFTFAHIQDGYYTSAMSIFAARSAYQWARNQLCRDLAGRTDAYTVMDDWAAKVPIGSNGVLFNPSLAGGTTQDKSLYIQGAFLGLSLSNTREDMIRAVLEGITMNLRLLLDEMETHIGVANDILVCGGGSKSTVWVEMFSDIFNKNIIKTNADQDIAVLGAAAIAARGCGFWRDYEPIAKLHHVKRIQKPNKNNVKEYMQLLLNFNAARDMLSEFGDIAHNDLRG